MIKLISIIALSFSAIANSAPVTFKVKCGVSHQDKVLADGEFTVSSMDDQTVYKDSTSEYLVGVSQVEFADGETSPLILLTIRKRGKMAAQSMSDFDAKKPGNVNLTLNYKSPWFNCRPVAN